MKVLDPAHRYELAGGCVLQFLKKELVPGPGIAGDTMKVTADGTTNEEVIEVLLDRLRGLNTRFPCRENALAITKLEEAQHWLEARTRARVRQGVEGKAAAHS